MPGWFSPAYKSQLCTLFSSFIFECHTGSLKLAIAGVFTPRKLENASNQSFLLPGSQFLKFINIPLLTYHSIEIILVKTTHDHKVAKSNMYFYLLFIWTLSHIWYSDHFFLLEMLSSTPRVFILLILQLLYWPLFLGPMTYFLFLNIGYFKIQSLEFFSFLFILTSRVISFILKSLNTLHRWLLSKKHF